jgi:hypothetical protein
MDGLAEGLFKRSKAGQLVFYPWGVSGQGYVLDSVAQKEELRNWIKKSIVGTLSIAIFLQITLGIYVILFVIPVALLHYRATMVKKLRDKPISEEPLGLGEAYRNAALDYRWTTLFIMEVLAVLFVIGGLYLLVDRGEVLYGALAAGASAQAALAIGYMIVKKYLLMR